MPLQNRVKPTGEIVAIPARGSMLGNRGGRFHDPETRMLIGNRRAATRRWICCRLHWRGRQRKVWGKSYTELFFSDDAAALAAGHRPCFECRREDAVAFQQAWGRAKDMAPPSADAMDLVLEAERRARAAVLRLLPQSDGLSRVELAELPDGTFVLSKGAPALVAKGQLWQWSFNGYDLLARQGGNMPVLTLPSVLGCLAAGYQPLWPDLQLAALSAQ
jgi:hypothetical protein